MNEKRIVFGIILLIIILGVLAFIFNGFSFSNSCNVGEAFFDLPSNYQLDSTAIQHKEGYVVVNITNGKNIISIIEYEDGDLEEVFQNYSNKRNNENYSLEVSNLTIDNNLVIKSVKYTDYKNVHYWFAKNGRVYEIFSWDTDENFEKNVEFMIKSIRFSNF